MGAYDAYQQLGIQKGIGSATDPYQSPRYMQDSSLITLTKTDKELQDLELFLRSQRIDKKGNIVSYGKPLLNREGINKILGMLETFVNKHTIMGNIDKHEVPKLIDFLADTLAQDLMLNKREYDIESESTRNAIFFAVLGKAFVVLKRGFQEGDRRFWKGSVQEIKTTVESPQDNKGLMGFINPWKKK